jgi:hypothetical protein
MMALVLSLSMIVGVSERIAIGVVVVMFVVVVITFIVGGVGGRWR